MRCVGGETRGATQLAADLCLVPPTDFSIIPAQQTNTARMSRMLIDTYNGMWDLTTDIKVGGRGETDVLYLPRPRLAASSLSR